MLILLVKKINRRSDETARESVIHVQMSFLRIFAISRLNVLAFIPVAPLLWLELSRASHIPNDFGCKEKHSMLISLRYRRFYS